MDLLKNKKSGSALVTTLLLMTLLIAVTLGVSFLLIREIRVSGDLLQARQAFYAAEGAAETALLQLKSREVGFELETKEEKKDLGFSFNYAIKNRAQNIPTFDADEYDLASLRSEDKYDVLDLNESVTIPLFWEDEGESHKVREFRVEYYVPYVTEQTIKKPNVEILYWKIFGLKPGTQDAEAITDIAPVDASSFGADQPTCFGTSQESQVSDTNYVCHYDTLQVEPVFKTYESLNIPFRNCKWDQVREFYGHNVNGNVVSSICYPIETFLLNHEQNFLVLSNMTNVDLLPTGISADKAKIYYRIKTFDEPLPRQYSLVRADGKSGKMTQSIDILLRRDELLPSFHFAFFGVK